ncbi:hypothetical protein SAMN06297129_0217 [Pseudooceanicola antarcticus]|uniref:DUF1365 domain-containing protein n=1 Tax=Pseudooceanicola antarcticus TaxID=1247613 RepID=A0A285HM23_9RHOB|nr:DUF1365 domain-containing protein [Pseudooceanicola antarcticus]PJE27817.1 DUF1365 domain-containing protein [Pseudooceanicola antarcticus]SNY36772.1 hypothetical protein SAMN06297129_0217 [Pseudooceanicola antarcticus]
MTAPARAFRPDHIRGTTVHARGGTIRHSFGYGVDYVLLDLDSPERPRLLARNRAGLATIHDHQHGGPVGKGEGAAWARRALARQGLAPERYDRLLLLTQPGFFGARFNPVSFWLAYRGEELRAVIAEVTNTFGDRHSYLCAHPDFAPIRPEDRLDAAKVFHVSPFREIDGAYSFNFHIAEERIAIRIRHVQTGGEALYATLTGPRRPLTNRRLLGAALRRPFGGVRVLALIYWQALRLRLKGARYHIRPAPPPEEIS